ncbi:hypothetical protein P152DRAFT_481797 [Eremomyces bilateralis CBS 781.70]|uniref:BTB domain-containing protein n=1 Tax=Eremomyces bilateralis CBS 781.70 TaxID=1392243 RepID=A0A6G1G4J2_9PEZI|nr:uncharacterized protein P152DRAFT_481797 [Eremomyces bilateralis CBS 781.70]KAF1812912.1 hypothetical protein P152DRAFT_481797 [Eremomyces bilateralis CBS 781.70]
MGMETSLGPVEYVVAGNNPGEWLEVKRAVLLQSPVLKGWIEDPTTCPFRKDGAIHLDACEPEVVKEVFFQMENGYFERQHGALTYARIYKLALALGLSILGHVALFALKRCSFSAETFLDIAIKAASDGLQDDRDFRDWITETFIDHRGEIKRSHAFSMVITQGSQNTRLLYELLMTCLVSAERDRDINRHGEKGRLSL